PDLVAGEGDAGRLVSYIRADESPHVAYLKTVLTEVRDRTVIGESGRRYAGRDIVGPIWDRGLENSLGVRRNEQLDTMRREVEHAVRSRADKADLLAEFDALGSVQRAATGDWTVRSPDA
ncbi:MAG TPA: hypothetical protein VID05_07745, partial [Acidimicrobiales bacterium]